jgi:FMN phosphatase YigB (HAD superfamily)
MLSDPQPARLSDVDAVFFDFGETLVTLAPSKEELFVQAASSIGLELTVGAVRRAYQIVDFHYQYSSVHVRDRNEFYRTYNQRLAEALGISSHFAGLGPALAAQFRNHKKWVLFDDVPDTLRRLQALHIPLAVVANWDDNLSSLLDHLEIKGAFSVVVPSQLAGVEKPDPKIFCIAAAKLSLSPDAHRILYVGNDYAADVVGARTAGLTPVLIDRDYRYQHADCRRFTSLLEWLDNMR